MPVRKIPMSGRSLTGRHATGAGGTAVGFESSLERDFITLMLFDPAVTSIEEQPVRIHFRDSNGALRRYTPDFLVHRDRAIPILAEVKPQKFLNRDLDDKFDAARRFARDRCWTFEVWTEHQIRTPRLENAKFLLPYKDREPPADARAKLLSTLAAQALAVAALINATSRDDHERGESLSALWHLVATGAVSTDLNAPLTPDSVIHLTGGMIQ